MAAKESLLLVLQLVLLLVLLVLQLLSAEVLQLVLSLVLQLLSAEVRQLLKLVLVAQLQEQLDQNQKSSCDKAATFHDSRLFTVAISVDKRNPNFEQLKEQRNDMKQF